MKTLYIGKEFNISKSKLSITKDYGICVYILAAGCFHPITLV